MSPTSGADAGAELLYDYRDHSRPAPGERPIDFVLRYGFCPVAHEAAGGRGGA